MDKISKYREHADGCRRLAAVTSNEEHKTALIGMAGTWEGLARQHVARMNRKARIAALENGPQSSSESKTADFEVDDL